MKLKIRSLSTFALATGLLLSSSQIQPVHADDHHARACSNKTLHGSFGFYRSGSTSTGPLAAVGIINFEVEFAFRFLPPTRHAVGIV